MVRWLLDTVVVSGLRRVSVDPRLFRWAVAHDPATTALSVITVLELRRGALLKTRRDPRQGRLLAAWLDDEVLPSYRGQVLPIDPAVAERAAALQVPDQLPLYDTLIAATALVHDLTVVTRNVQDFEPMGVRVLDPWQD